MRNVIVLSAAVFMVGLTACAKKASIAERARRQAPTASGDVGVLIENAEQAEVESLLGAHPEARVRVLHREQGLYEIFGVSAEDVADKVSAKIAPNAFFKAQQQHDDRQVHELFARPAPEGLVLPGLNRCKRALLAGPTAALNVTEPVTVLNGATIELGTKIKMNTHGSRLATKTVIAVLPPTSSLLGEKIVPGPDFEFTPDALGLYQAVAVAQDASDNCSIEGVAFIVSANRPYQGANVPVPQQDLALIGHLPQIQAEESWALSEGAGVLIAIVDSGVNYNHPHLAGAIAVNEAEIADNGLDDDANGFIDDVLGHDFVNGDEFPYDDSGHGSHVAGLAAGRAFGLARKSSILAVKAMSALGGDIGSVAAGIRYAADRGARVINLSLGGGGAEPHPMLTSAVDYAASKGAVLIVAAGNGDPNTGLGFSIDDNAIWPASYENDAIVSVAAGDRFNPISVYSNFGLVGVDVVAPGGLIPLDPMYSATEENPSQLLLAGMQGTSMAAPVVSGIAAQVIALKPSLSASDVRALLISAGSEDALLKTAIASGRKLSALSAVQLAAAPSVVSN